MRVQRSRSSAIVVFCRPVCTPKVRHGAEPTPRPCGDLLDRPVKAEQDGRDDHRHRSRQRHRDRLRDPRRPRRRAAAARHGPRRPADRLARSSWSTRSSTAASSSIRYDNRDVGLSTKLDGDGGGLDFMAQFMAAFAGRAVEAPYLLTDMAADGIGAARPPRHRLGPHRRRVDGRDDRADDGHRAPDAGAHAHVDHVDHRRRRRRPARPPRRCRRSCSPPATDPRRGRSPARVETSRDHQQPGPLRRGARPEAGRGGLRPLLQPGGRRPPAARHPRVGQPGRGPRRSSTSRRS